MKKTCIPDEVSSEELAAILGITSRSVRNLATAGTITRTASGKYVLADSIRSIIAEAKKSKPVNGLSRENEAIAAGKRRLLEMRIAQEDRKLIDLNEAVDVTASIVGVFRAGLDGLPSRITSNREDRKRIRVECDAMLSRVSQKIEKLKKGDTTDEDERSDDDE